MRINLYAIFNKETNERVYTDARRKECEKVLATMDNRENFEIRSKFVSI